MIVVVDYMFFFFLMLWLDECRCCNVCLLVKIFFSPLFCCLCCYCMNEFVFNVRDEVKMLSLWPNSQLRNLHVSIWIAHYYVLSVVLLAHSSPEVHFLPLRVCCCCRSFFFSLFFLLLCSTFSKKLCQLFKLNKSGLNDRS